jgi:hypothetical protein
MSYPVSSPRTQRPCGCRRACPHPAQRPCSRCTLATGSRPLPRPGLQALAQETSRPRKGPHYDAHMLAAVRQIWVSSHAAEEVGESPAQRWRAITVIDCTASGTSDTTASSPRRHLRSRARLPLQHKREPECGKSYIWLTEPATSGHSRSISSFSRCRANERRAGSGSERKPTTPAAEVRPTIVLCLAESMRASV